MTSEKTTATIYDPLAESRNPDRAIAHANTAISVLLKAIEETMRPAHGANWDHVGSAHHVANELLNLYASISDRASDETFELPCDGGRGRPMRFTLEGF